MARAVAENGLIEAREFRGTCKAGRVRDTLISAVVLDDRLLVGLMDITELRQAERELRSAREALERTAYEVTEAIPVGTYSMVLAPGAAMVRFSFMSKRFLELSGVSREEAEGDTMSVFACVHPEDFDDWVRLNAEAFAEKRPFFGQTRIIVDGEVRWITAESVPRDLPDGSTVWEGVLIDVTERVRAEQALICAREKAESANWALRHSNLELKRLATTDQLTGAHREKGFTEKRGSEPGRVSRPPTAGFRDLPGRASAHRQRMHGAAQSGSAVAQRGPSALDVESERLVQEALEHLMQGLTSIVIARVNPGRSRGDPRHRAGRPGPRRNQSGARHRR